MTPPVADNALVRIDAARRALSSARTVPELKTFMDQASTLRYWLKRRGATFDTLHVACELKLRAERRLGELLVATVKQGRPSKRSDARTFSGRLPEDVTKQRARDWRQLFILSDAAFERYLDDTKTEQLEPTLVGAMRLLRDAARSKRKAARSRALWHIPSHGGQGRSPTLSSPCPGAAESGLRSRALRRACS